MRHKHYDVIVAFAEGKKIQLKLKGEGWKDWPFSDSPTFCEDSKWRVKPDVKKYRVALTYTGPVAYSCPGWEEDIEQDDNFIRWISDWVEYE